MAGRLLIEILHGISIEGLLPNAILETSYSAQLTARNAVLPLAWLKVGGTWPPTGGWDIDASTGLVTGDADDAGMYGVTIQLTDGAGNFTLKDFSFRIVAAPLLFSGDLADATVGDSASYSYTISGGVGTKTVTLVSGAMPNGVSIDSAGNVTGTYTVGDSFAWTLRVVDADSTEAFLSDSSVIAWLPLSVAGAFSNTVTGNALAGSPLAISGGQTPYGLSGSPYSGARPTGVSINVSGASVVATGTVSASGTYTWIERVTSTDGQHYDKACSIVAAYPTLSVSGTFTGVVVGSPLGGSPLTISGGLAPYSLSGSPFSGTRPAGVTISISGSTVVATGNTTTGGTFTWTERVLSSDSQHYDVSCSVVVTVPITYPVWNPSDTNNSPTLSNANRTFADKTGGTAARATLPKSAGKWYWEVIQCASPNSNVRAGLESTGGACPGTVGNGSPPSCAFAGHGFRIQASLFGAQASPVPTAGQHLMFAWNAGTGDLWIGCNGSWFWSGNPAAGTSPAITGITGTCVPAASLPSGTTRTYTICAAPADCSFSPPSGFTNWHS